ncbi:hypothetical protein BV20DRAFT_19934 [Pilatotrama ljubarskyi]|nr:hypothetical protein BV20DRAFT_19934 [Pilatotrama ljubarskyi]
MSGTEIPRTNAPMVHALATRGSRSGASDEFLAMDSLLTHFAHSVTRASEFRKHLLKKHGIEARDLTVYKVPRKPKADSGMPVAGPSGAEGNGPRKSSRPQSASTAPPAPPYSEAIHGGVPLIVTPSDDGQASTPGLSFGSPSPSPAPELCYERNAEMPGPSSAHGVLEACPGT